MENQNPNQDRHLWQFTWVRDLAIIAAVITLLLLTYKARSVTAPVLLGLAFAYVFHPAVGFLEKKRCPRWAGVSAILLAAIGTFTALLLVLIPTLISQFIALLTKLPDYVNAVSNKLGIDWQAVISRLQESATEKVTTDVSASAAKVGQYAGPVAATMAKILASALAYLNSAIDAITYLGLASFIVAFCFFFFSWKWADITKWFDQFIIESKRTETLHIIGKMDRTVSAFVRGRLIQSMVMGIILSIGWCFAGVPYWLILGMGAGLLNLVPFLAVIGWILALILATVDQLSTGGSNSITIWTFILPTLVYAIAQGLDGWVVEPTVQGKATNLDPLSVMLAVLIGGTLAGLLGLIVAIPIAACIKILAQEVVLPRIRHYTANQ